MEVDIRPRAVHHYVEPIENRVQVWLDDFHLAVSAEERSEGTAREYRRYARTHFT